jgi:hypothetical protein
VAWILKQWDDPVLEQDGDKHFGDNAATIPDAVHFSGIVYGIAHVFDTPRLGSKQFFHAGHVSE